MDIQILLITVCIFLGAVLYSSVGHGGASAYLAIMALFGLAPEQMKPAALTLNILVAGLGTWRYLRAGLFNFRLFWPLVLASAPMAFLGGSITLDARYYQPLVGIVLLYAAWHFFAGSRERALTHRPPPLFLLLLCGALIGLLSGLTGVGGGIFLSPVLVLLAWAPLRQASGVAAAFILLNSASGLLGAWSAGITLPDGIVWWGTAAVAGGLIGTELGRRRLAVPALRRLLGLVLVIAGLKMVLLL